MSGTAKRSTKSQNPTKTTPVVMDFLVETIAISQDEGRVSLRALADRLEVSPPAVSRMAQRLVRRGFLKREGACGLALTDSGQSLANQAIRKRRIYEVFLIQTLGYKWYDVYPVASASSNHITDDVIGRMFVQTGSPDRCPHGDPIPTPDGKIEEIECAQLSRLTEGATGVLSRVSSHDTEMLRYLDSLNLRPGVPVELIARAPFGGPLRVRVTNGSFQDQHIIGAELAAKIWIE